jgi:hypothetical protein
MSSDRRVAVYMSDGWSLSGRNILASTSGVNGNPSSQKGTILREGIW